jgi:hypothetical protein
MIQAKIVSTLSTILLLVGMAQAQKEVYKC